MSVPDFNRLDDGSHHDARFVGEREWSDEFGTHYEVKMQGRSGRVYSQAVTRDPVVGWLGTGRRDVFENVRRAMIAGEAKS